MTIAAGFIHRDGILLCSDTQQEAAVTKFHGPKIGMFECAAGKFCFALAGRAAFATSAIQKCVEALRVASTQNAISILETTLDKEYRRVVYQHPDYSTDHTLAYWLLIAYWPKDGRRASLFVTDEVTLHSCYGFQAVGLGLELANVLVRPFDTDDMGEEEAMILAAYMMAMVKENVAGCGGISQFLAVRNDGTTSPVMNVVLDEVERVAVAYDKAAHELLLSMAMEDDSILSQKLEEFGEHARAVRDYWSKLKRANPAVSGYLQLPIAFRSRQQP